MKTIGAVLAVLASGCVLDPIVGGDCIDGWLACDGVCVDPTTDPNACGGCGRACTEGSQCIAGQCVGGDCILPEVWCDGAACADLETDPANCGACGLACDAGDRCSDGSCVAECPEERLDCDGACVDPSRDPRHCGGCGLACEGDDVCVDGACSGQCPGATTQCGRLCIDTSRDPEHCGGCETACDAGESCDAGTCVGVCGDGLTSCARQCVDVAVDPDNCGGCGISCDTGICEAGRCRVGLVGHLVLIGHDYLRTRRDQGRLVANAALIAQGDATVVTYAGVADPDGVANAEAAVLQAAAAAGRRLTLVPLDDPDRLGESLAAASVFLVHAQCGAEPEALSALGEVWRDALSAFVGRGGVVIVLDGPSTAQLGGTWRIVSAAGLAAIEGSNDVTGQTLDLVDPGDAVALGMAARYRAERHSVSFVAPEADAVVAAAGDPVVVHEVFWP